VTTSIPGLRNSRFQAGNGEVLAIDAADFAIIRELVQVRLERSRRHLVEHAWHIVVCGRQQRLNCDARGRPQDRLPHLILAP
jgi:hypothetical protein